MADTEVTALVSGAQERTMLWGPYWSDISTAVIVYFDDGEDLTFARTTNKGASHTLTEVEVGDCKILACWYDKETPGDTGTLVHMVWIDRGGTDAVNYRTIDVATGVLGTAREIDATITAAANAEENKVGITKTVGGNLIAAFSTQTEIGCSRSVDSGENWTSRADVYETTTEEDVLFLYPANTTNNQDAVAIFQDRSADTLSIKMYDDTANDWTETAIGSYVDVANHVHFDAAVLHSNKHIMLAAHSEKDSAGDDLLTWDLTVDDIDTPTVTARTNIFTNQAEATFVGVVINQQIDRIYVAYQKGGTAFGLTDVVFHTSDDDMVTWGGENGYSETTDDNRGLAGGRTISSAGGRIQWVFQNDDLAKLYVNEVNDIEIVSFVPYPNPRYALTGGIQPQGGGIS